MNLSKAPPNPLSLRHQTALVQTRHMCVLLQPGISLPVSSQHSWQLLNAIPKTARFQNKEFKHSSEPLQRKIEGDMHESVPNSLEDDLSGLCEEGVKESSVGLKGMQGQARNTNLKKKTGIRGKKNAERR